MQNATRAALALPLEHTFLPSSLYLSRSRSRSARVLLARGRLYFSSLFVCVILFLSCVFSLPPFFASSLARALLQSLSPFFASVIFFPPVYFFRFLLPTSSHHRCVVCFGAAALYIPFSLSFVFSFSFQFVFYSAARGRARFCLFY